MHRGLGYETTVADVIVEKLNNEIKSNTVKIEKSLVTSENITQTENTNAIKEETI